MIFRYLIYGVLLCLLFATTAHTQTYTGNLYYQSDVSYGLDVVAPNANNTWRNFVEFEWTVTKNTVSNNYPWTYLYVAAVNSAAPSPIRIFVETDNNFTLSDIDLSSVIVTVNNTVQSYNINNIVVGTINPTAGPDSDFSNLPEARYGVLFSNLTDGSKPTDVVSVQFNSSFGPGWGDLYMNCTSCSGPRNIAWNSGFLSDTPELPPNNGSVSNHILVPKVPIPEPGTIMLLASGMLLVLTGRKRR